MADVFGEPLSYVDSPERPAVGAALLGGIAAGVFGSYAEAADASRSPLQLTEPDPERVRPDDPPEIVGDPTRLRELGWTPAGTVRELLERVWSA